MTAYEQKLQDEVITVFSDISQNNILSIHDTSYYNIDHDIDTTIILVPSTTKNVKCVKSINQISTTPQPSYANIILTPIINYGVKI